MPRTKLVEEQELGDDAEDEYKDPELRHKIGSGDIEEEGAQDNDEPDEIGFTR
jgi:hypothetical protein